MIKKEFKDMNNKILIVSYNRTNIFLSGKKEDYENNKNQLNLNFSKEMRKEIVTYLRQISNKIWLNFHEKEATSFSSDYNEYYDKKYDNDGSLFLFKNSIKIEGPDDECPYLYKFNKRRMESFIYDLK